MPLHLLGKKSWNVYNADNIERVRRDEAAAAAAEEAAEQRMQEVDAARRTAILRGETPPPLHDDEVEHGVITHSNARDGTDSWDREQRRKRRKLKGEDDTDRDIRLARQDAQAGHEVKERFKERDRKDIVVTDAKGHIQLFDSPSDDKSTREAEREAKRAERKKREDEESTGMQFKHAAGYKAGTGDPWYASKTSAGSRQVANVGRDAFGNDDPKRKDRDEKRVASNDPMAMMRQAQKKLKDAGRAKAEWEGKQRDKIRRLDEVEQREKELRRHSHRSRTERSKPGGGSDDSLEGFSLDTKTPRDGRPPRERRNEDRRTPNHHDRVRDHKRQSDHDRHRHRHRHRSRSPRRG